MWADGDDEVFLNTTPSPVKRPQIADLSVIWKDKREESAFLPAPIKSQFSVKNPPFGLDHDLAPVEEPARGYRKGGSKEARLFRVALLAAKKEVDNLHPIKVLGIPEDVKEEELSAQFSKYGPIGDVYIPRNLKRMTAREFALIRFEKEESALKAVAASTEKLKSIKGRRKSKDMYLGQLPKQWSVFTSNSGVHGITNEISDDMRQTEWVKSTKKLEFKQNITLDQCFSRSGYPWGSKAELKILESHAPKEVLLHKAIKVGNLKETTSPETIREAFNAFGPSLTDVYCPKTLNVVERNIKQVAAAENGETWHNEGFAYVRFGDRRDYLRALRSVEEGRVVVDGAVVSGDSITPFSWPTDRTRRYF